MGKVPLGNDLVRAREINRGYFQIEIEIINLSLIDYAKDILKSTPLESAHILLDGGPP